MIKFFSKVDDKRRNYLNKNMLVLKEQYLNIKDMANFGITTIHWILQMHCKTAIVPTLKLNLSLSFKPKFSICLC